ncbi:MAG: hypothetical protein IJ192_05340 [Clostridia bacterium]|nr:hypothetical protein [Clostridia bacterium]
MKMTDRQKRKAVAVLLCMVITFIMLLSSLYVLIQADHDCTGADCVVCLNIQQCENTLRLISSGATIQNVAAALVFIVALVVVLYSFEISTQTPVRQKVRMNN